MVHAALSYALQASVTLFLSHGLCVAILMYLDLSGRWKQYALCETRTVTADDYIKGFKSFMKRLMFPFFPFMLFCFWHRADAIAESQDTWLQSITKLVTGYVTGKLWAFAIHYALHFSSLYPFHRRHHQNPKKLVASAAWEDSLIEHAIMELPSFGICIWFLPTHFGFHCAHFAWHGMDGAAGHSGFKAPGWLGYLMDGEYHYYHHAHLTVNYAELEVLDKVFGTHHTQRQGRAPKKVV